MDNIKLLRDSKVVFEDRCANCPVICWVCGKRLKDGIPYFKAVSEYKNFREDVCLKCHNDVLDPTSSITYEFKKAMEDFKKRIR